VLPTALSQVLGPLVTLFMTNQVGLVVRPTGVTEPIEAIAASEEGVVVVTRAGPFLLDSSGRRIRTLWSVESRVDHRQFMKVDGSDVAPGLPADVDWARGSDTEEIDDTDDPRLADGFTPEPDDPGDAITRAHQTLPTAAATDVSVAAAGPNAWVGHRDGLWQVNLATGGARRAVRADAGRPAIHSVASSTDGRTVVFVAGHTLVRSSNGGQTFEPVATLPTSPHGVAATNSGAIVFIDGADGAAHVVPPDELDDVTALPIDPVMDLASCGAAVILLHPHALLAVRWSSNKAIVDRQTAVPTGTRRIACGSDEQLWATTGEELFSSDDWGRSWSRRGDIPPGSTRGLAPGGTTIWIASASGLWAAIPGAGADREQASIPRFDTPSEFRALSELRRPSIARVSPDSLRWWSTVLPQVDLVAAAGRRGGRRDVRGLILLTFSFSPRRTLDAITAASLARGGPARRLPDVVTAREVGAGGRDPVDVEEHEALLTIIEDDP
jgi:hypothetical protein